MPTALVTGAAGFIGSHLVEELLDREYEVCGLDDLSSGTLANLDSVLDRDAFGFVEGDVRDADTLAGVMEGVDQIFHQAADVSVQRSFENPSTTTSVNCTGTAIVFEVAAEFEVETIIVASSAAVYGSGGALPKREEMAVAPESPYAASKHYAEQLVLQLGRRYGIDAVALRYFNVFGPRQDPGGEYAAVVPKFVDLMLDGDRPTIYGDGEQSRDFVYIDDVVAANVLAAERECDGGVYNVARGDQLTINELVAILNRVLGTEIDPEYAESRSGDVRHSQADVSKAKREFGYEPTVGLEAGLRQTVEVFDDR